MANNNEVNQAQAVEGALVDLAKTGLGIASVAFPVEAGLGLLALTALDRMIDAYIELGRRDPNWKPQPLVDAYPTWQEKFQAMAAAGRALKAAEAGGA